MAREDIHAFLDTNGFGRIDQHEDDIAERARLDKEDEEERTRKNLERMRQREERQAKYEL